MSREIAGGVAWGGSLVYPHSRLIACSGHSLLHPPALLGRQLLFLSFEH